MPRTNIITPTPGIMPEIDINRIPSIRDIGKKPEDDKSDDVRPKGPPCPNCGKHHWPYNAY